MALHIKCRVHLRLVALDLDKGEIIDRATGFLEELVSGVASPLEALKRMDAHTAGVRAGRHCASSGHCLATRKGRGVLLHLHGEGPVRFSLENQDLQVLGALGDELSCDGFLHVDVFLVLLL